MGLGLGRWVWWQAYLGDPGERTSALGVAAALPLAPLVALGRVRARARARVRAEGEGEGKG